MKFPVYQSEIDLGLAEAVRLSGSMVLAGEIQLSESFPLSERSLAYITKATNRDQPDLHYLSSILVTAGWDMDTERGVPAGWNRNDDFFDPLEVWISRQTPEDKPVNEEHDCARVIGHITSNSAVDADGKAIADDVAIDALPGKFHLVTGSVLYKVWDNPELQQRMDRLLAEIAEGQWHVSMECLFSGFDYVVVSGGQAKAIARNKETAFLTKHLRAYGGNGTYDGQKIGRLLRNIVFSGKGMVRRPANPDSKVLTTAQENFSSQNNSGYSSVTEKKENEQPMTVEIEKQVAELTAEVERLKSSQAELQAKLVATEKARDEAEALNQELASQKQTLEASLKTSNDELSSIKAKARRIERLSQVKTLLSVDEADTDAVKAAEALVDSLADKNDEAFVAHIQAVAKFTPAKTPPKSTPAPLPPKSTTKPAVTATAADLEGAEPQPEPDLASDADAKVESLRVSLAKAFGFSEKTE